MSSPSMNGPTLAMWWSGGTAFVRTERIAGWRRYFTIARQLSRGYWNRGAGDEPGAGVAGAAVRGVVRCDCTRSNRVRAASTQARVDSSPPQTTRSCVSPLRRTKRAPRPVRSSSSSSRMERPRGSSLSPSHRSCQRSRRPSSLPEGEFWPQAGVPTRTNPAASKSAFRMEISVRTAPPGPCAGVVSDGASGWNKTPEVNQWAAAGFPGRRCRRHRAMDTSSGLPMASVTSGERVLRNMGAVS